MPTTNPRINVTFSPSDGEVLNIISKKKQMSMSSLVRKVVEDWIEEYEDMMLARRAEEAEARWIADGCKTYTMEELCQEYGIELNSEENPNKTSTKSLKTSGKGSSRQSKKGLRSRPKKLANH